MTYYSIEDIIKDIRVVLDQNMSSEALSELGDIDTLSLDELIRSKIEDAALAVIKAAPISKLGDITERLIGSVSISDSERHVVRVKLPKDFARLVRFKMKSWPRAVYGAEPPISPYYEQANSEFGILGTRERPVVFLVPSPVGGGGLHIEAFCAVSEEDEEDGCLYVGIPKIVQGDILVTDIALNKSELTIGVGGEETLNAYVSPSDATNKELAWESDDEEVATVDDGVVTGVGEGTCTITCNSTDGSDVSDECEVTVIIEPIHVTDVTLNESELSLNVRESVTLEATVYPDDATNKAVIWESDDENVATVDSDGVVTCIGEGTCNITCTSEDNSEAYAVCELTVIEEFVDLGLPSGTLWKKRNVGATNPEDGGDFFAWGETEGKDEFSWNDYQFGTKDALTKYNTTDEKTELESVDDAAIANCGNRWKIPSKEQIEELIEYCTYSFVEQDGVNGVLFEGNRNSIFLPSAGGYKKVENDDDTFEFYGEGVYGYYMSSRRAFTAYNAHSLVWNSDFISITSINRARGCNIRPVYVPPTLPNQAPHRPAPPTPTSGTSGESEIALGKDLVRPTVYYAAALTALAIKDGDAATALKEIAKDILEN